jgi:hypothetical protein
MLVVMLFSVSPILTLIFVKSTFLNRLGFPVLGVLDIFRAA